MQKVTVLKCNLQGEETWRYQGQVMRSAPEMVLIEARFNRSDLPFHGVTLRENDRFVEIYFADRWYNIFEVHDKDDDRIKCWYCNICKPAVFEDGVISYIDLALDLLVYPDGQMLVLDEDEFTAMEMEEAIRQAALSSINDLQQWFSRSKIIEQGLEAFYR